jgi:hypothetical protein
MPRRGDLRSVKQLGVDVARRLKLGEIRRWPIIALVQREEAAGHMQGQREIAEVVREGVKIRIVGREVRAVLAQEGDTLGARQRCQLERLHAQRARPSSAAAGDEHATTAILWSPAIEQRLILTVIEDQ